MSKFTIYNETNAPEASRATLSAVKSSLGFIPNLMGTMAEAPAALNAYVQLMELIGSSTLSPQEQRLVTLAISQENTCDYCIAAEGMLAHKVNNIALEDVQAVQNGSTPADQKLQALVTFAKEVSSTRGYPSEETTNKFLAAGYSKANILEVVVGVSMKVLSTYTNHIAETPIDDAFSAYIPGAEEAA